MRVTIEPGPVGGVMPVVPLGAAVSAGPAAPGERRASDTQSWQRRALRLTLRIGVRTFEHLLLVVLLAPVIVLLGGLVVGCTIAVLAPFVALPIVHQPMPWPTLLTQGLASLGVQDPRLIPALMAGLAWLGVSSAAMLLLLGIRWP